MIIRSFYHGQFFLNNLNSNSLKPNVLLFFCVLIAHYKLMSLFFAHLKKKSRVVIIAGQLREGRETRLISGKYANRNTSKQLLTLQSTSGIHKRCD